MSIHFNHYYRRNNTWHTLDALHRYARLLGYGEIYQKIDQKTGLNACIAVHNTNRGPAIGGCRIMEYTSANFAMKDALRLGYMMTLKAAATDLPHGGAKAVIMKPKHIKDRRAFFQSFGEFVHNLNGRYITAIDVGSTTDDMDAIATRTPYVVGATSIMPEHGDPSPFTGLGLVRSMEAAIKYKLGRENFEGLHVAFQGAGRVAYAIMKNIHARGAKITVADINQEATDRCADEFNADVVSTDKIFSVPCDIFSPCAMGSSLNLKSIAQLNCKIIVGAANNQLAHRKYIYSIMQKNILYAPDFIANAGGLIYASSLYRYNDASVGNAKIDNLSNIILKIFKRADEQQLPTTEIAELIAKENLYFSGDRETPPIPATE